MRKRGLSQFFVSAYALTVLALLMNSLSLYKIQNCTLQYCILEDVVVLYMYTNRSGR